MENLNDVEFGSDKGTEEAPILVAQRYLNIYRQIHIFNKEKRDQFDNELLALPQNITDFFKRMPGGRLLVEHIEEVKTERGISFVKSNKEDFTTESHSNTSTTSTSAQTAAGGTVAIDASFAQTLAQSMANAFKQLPAQNVSGNNIAAPSSADFSKAFDLIAEEIKVSRASLLDVLQEMHTVTSSLIASQVSIARTLESILSKSGTETVVVRPNTVMDRRMPQQEQETLRNAEASSKYENEMPARPTQPLAPNVKPAQPQILQPVHPETQIRQPSVPPAPSAAALGDEINRKKKKKKKNKENRVQENPHPISDNQMAEYRLQHLDKHAQPNTQPSEPSLAVKSEKLVPAFEGIIRSATAKHLDADTPQLDTTPLNNAVESTSNSDDFSSTLTVKESVQPINDETKLAMIKEKENPQIGLDDLADFINDKTSIQSSTNSAQEEKSEISPFDNSESIFDSDGLDFALPEQNTASDTNEFSAKPLTDSLDNVFNSDGLDYALPEQSSVQIDSQETPLSHPQTTNLDDIFNEDGLDFTLPESNSQTEDDINVKQANADNLDSMFSSDDLDFVLPEQPVVNKIDEPSPQDSLDNLDSILNNNDLSTIPVKQNSVQVDETAPAEFSADSLDSIFAPTSTKTEFSLPEQTLSPTDEETESLPSLDNLDDILADNSLNTALSEQHLDTHQAIDHDGDLTSLDSLASHISATNSRSQTVSDNEGVSVVPQQEPHQSRYSAELDRIRTALTSDNIDVSSLDQPIALDDYDDDEGILNKEDETMLDSVQSYVPSQDDMQQPVSSQSDGADSEDWDWEYVDENGNPVSTSGDDEDWEWEYVEDDGTEDEPDNNNK